MYLPKSALVSKMSLTNMPKAYASIEWPVLGVMLTWLSYQTNNFLVTHSFKIHVIMPNVFGELANNKVVVHSKLHKKKDDWNNH